MSLAGNSGMAENYHARPRERLSAYLRRQYPITGRDKQLAREIGTSARAARNLFDNHWPGDETWAAIVRRFGADVLRAVFAPEIEPVLAELTAREASLARELDSLRARRREVEGDRKSFVEPLEVDPAEAPSLAHSRAKAGVQ